MFFTFVNMLNLVCGLFSILLSLFILRKDRKETLNILLFLTFFCWALNVFFYSLVEWSSAGSMVVNLVRDINVFFGIFSAFCVFFAGAVLKNGKAVAFRTRNIGVMGMIWLMLTITALFDDSIAVNVVLDTSIVITPLIATFTIFIIPGFIALFGVRNFYQVYKEAADPNIKKRIRFFVIGTLLLILGALIFGLSGILGLPSSETTDIIIGIPAELCWALGPVCALLGLSKK